MSALPVFLTTAETVASFLGVDLLNPNPADWNILNNATNQVVITPDTVSNFDYKTDTRVSDFPVQRGAFASYNKVQMPAEIRMVLICSGINFVQSAVNSIIPQFGANFMEKDAFLTTLESMRSGTDLYNIITPDAQYKGFTLERFDYARSATQGATMLAVDAVFREVRQVGTANASVNGLPSVNSNSDSAANPVNNGVAQTYAYGTNPASLGIFE
jgi:hypothetical protein